MLDIARHSRWNRPPKSLPKSKNCLSHLSGQLQSLWSLANEKSFLTMTNSKPINWSKDYWSVGFLTPQLTKSFAIEVHSPGLTQR
jgi:hypothetical protein